MKNVFLICFSCIFVLVNANTDSSGLKISGYVEAYYSYDLGNPENHTRPGFIYSHNRHNELSLNLGLLKAAYEKNDIRANLALMAGSYSNANLAAEPGVLKNIFEANVGFKLSKKKNLWVDAGIFPSHIGLESAIGKDCWTLTRSMAADNSPYYESGVKISYTSANGKWFISGLLLNGWQRIQRADGDNSPAIGHQLTFKPSPAITLNSSSYIGSINTGNPLLIGYFHDFYGIFQLDSHFATSLGFDIGAKKIDVATNSHNKWFAPFFILQYSNSKKLRVTARSEYYIDPNQVIIATGTPNGFQTFSYSLNLDYAIKDNLIWRIEGRSFSSKDEIFILNSKPSTQNYFFTTSLAISF